MSAPDRRTLLDREHGKLSVRRQCVLLGLARSGVYREPAPASGDDLMPMHRLDQLFTDWPFLGSRRRAALLRAEGQARAAADAADGHRGAGAEAAHDHTGGWAQDLPVSAACCGDRSTGSGLGGGHDLHPDRARLPVSGGDHGLGEPGGAGVATIEYAGHFVLPLRARRSASAVRQTGNLQHRPGRSVHQPGLH